VLLTSYVEKAGVVGRLVGGARLIVFLYEELDDR
jgi:hypothetical protein